MTSMVKRKAASFHSIEDLARPGHFLASRSIDDLDQNGQTALFRAILQNDVATCETLIAQGADVEKEGLSSQYNLKMAPLCQAVRQGSIAIVKLLISANCNLEKADNFTSSPLKLAINRTNKDMIRLLLDSGCQLNVCCGENFFTPLHTACNKGNAYVVKLLLDAGSDPNIPETVHLQNPAFYTQSVPIYNLLLQHGLDLNATNRCGETVLHQAIINANYNLVKFLVESGVELNSPGWRYQYGISNVLQRVYKRAPLSLALEETHFEICKLLVQHGCEVSFLRDVENNDALLRIVNSCNLEFIMVCVFGCGNWPWTSLVRQNSLSHFFGRDALEVVWQWLTHTSKTPFKLKALCRVQIRQSLQHCAGKRSILPLAHKLPLPETLKEYLSLKCMRP